MMFKNAMIFQLRQAIPDELILADYAAKPVGLHETEQTGWVAPINDDSDDLVFTSQNGLVNLLCMRLEKKVLPTGAINKLLNKKIAEIEAQEGRKVKTKNKNDIKAEIVFDLLPKALVVEERIYGYIDSEHNLVVVNTASAKKAEAFLTLLRKTLGTLDVVPIATNSKLSEIMTGWLSDKAVPECFEIGDECRLENNWESCPVVTIKREDLFADEVVEHIYSGKECTSLGLTWNEGLSFVVNNELTLKKLAFMFDVDDEQEQSDLTKFETDFYLMHQELTGLILALGEQFGGFSA